MNDILSNLQVSNNKKTKHSIAVIEKIRFKLETISTKFDKDKFVKQVVSIDKIPNSFFQSQYIFDEVQNEIREKKYKVIECKTKIHNRSIIIYILSKKDIIPSIYLKKMWSILNLLIPFSSNKCGTTIKITLLLSTLSKQFPTSNNIIIGPQNVNSGVSYSCAVDGDIFIYREEEWFKVFIHELFHCLGLDFNHLHNNILIDTMKRRFCVRSDFLVFESYTEFWANIIHTIYKYNELKNTASLLQNKDLSVSLYDMIETEIKFSMFQMIKILWFMNTSYQNIINSKTCSNIYLYNEDTNVFSYYILKLILLYNYIDFIEWCMENNKSVLQFDKTQHCVQKLDQFFHTFYKNSSFLKDIKQNEKILKKFIQKNKITQEDIKQLRMTYYG